MTLLRRGKVWHIDIADPDAPNGRFRKSTGITDKVVAKALHDKKTVEIANRKLGFHHLLQSKIKKITISQFRDEYAAYRNHLSPATLEVDKYAFNSLIKILGDVLMNSVGITNVRKFKTELIKDIKVGKKTIKGKSPTTFNIYHKHLSAAFNLALNWESDWRYIEANPFISVPRIKVNKRARRSLSGEELVKFFATILSDETADDREKFADLMRVYLIFGLRRSEALRLTPKDLDWDRNFFIVRDKKEKQDALMPLTPDLMDVFKRNRGSDDEPFFDYKPDRVTRRFKRYAIKAGIPDATPHYLRHTVATMALSDLKQDPESVKNLLGHSDLRTTMIYVHSDPSLKLGIISELNKLIDGFRDKAIKKINDDKLNM